MVAPPSSITHDKAGRTNKRRWYLHLMPIAAVWISDSVTPHPVIHSYPPPGHYPIALFMCGSCPRRWRVSYVAETIENNCHINVPIAIAILFFIHFQHLNSFVGNAAFGPHMPGVPSLAGQ